MSGGEQALNEIHITFLSNLIWLLIFYALVRSFLSIVAHSLLALFCVGNYVCVCMSGVLFVVYVR